MSIKDLFHTERTVWYVTVVVVYSSLSFSGGSRVEGNILFLDFFLEKVIIDAINVIKTNK